MSLYHYVLLAALEAITCLVNSCLFNTILLFLIYESVLIKNKMYNSHRFLNALKLFISNFKETLNAKAKINALIFDSDTKTVSIQTENKFRC